MNSARKTPPIRKHLLPFLDYCEIEKGLADNTQRTYAIHLQRFTSWLDQAGCSNLTPEQLSPEHIWDYRLHLARSYRLRNGRHLSKVSQNQHLIAIRALLNYWAARNVTSLPSSQVTLAKTTGNDTIEFLTREEIHKLLEQPDTSTSNGLRDRTILELLFSSGLRISELVSLNLAQMSGLDPDSTETTYELSITGKGGITRTIFISPRAARWLCAYADTRTDALEPLFINQRSATGDRRLTPRAIQFMVAKTARLAGISKAVTPHVLRHSYATDLLGHGADLRSVQELLGHKNVATTQIYTHVTNKQLRDVHRRFHDAAKRTQNDAPS